MAHSVSEAAARAVKNSERKKPVETRSPEKIIKDIRGNLVAHLSITSSDIVVLLSQFDAVEAQYQAAVKIISARNHEIDDLQDALRTEKSLHESV